MEITTTSPTEAAARRLLRKAVIFRAHVHRASWRLVRAEQAGAPTGPALVLLLGLRDAVGPTLARFAEVAAPVAAPRALVAVPAE